MLLRSEGDCQERTKTGNSYLVCTVLTEHQRDDQKQTKTRVYTLAYIIPYLEVVNKLEVVKSLTNHLLLL